MIIKEGILYKQRDHLRGWLPRYFTLDHNFLHYYLNKDEIIPRNSFQICRGIIVITDIVAKVSNGVTYYPFTITHPNSMKQYHLSSIHLSESIAWAKAIQALANGENISRSSISSISQTSENTKKLSKEVVVPVSPPQGPTLVEENLAELKDTDPLQKALTLSNISEDLILRIEKLIDKILSFTINCTEEWIPMFERNGVIGMKRPGSGLICVRGETILPYTIPEIYGLISLPDRRKELDPQLDTYTRMKEFSYHTGTEHLLFKAIWPTAPRDFSNITHWRLLKNGTFVTIGFGDHIPDCPEQDGVVRGNLLIGGYVMQPVKGGTRIFIVVQSDVGGSLPTAITNMAAESQPMVLVTMRKLLDQAYKGKPRPDLTSIVPNVSYAGSEPSLRCSRAIDILAIEKFNFVPAPIPTVNSNDDDEDRSSSDHSFTSEETSLRDAMISGTRSSLVSSPYLKEGILYKQRDLVKKWLPRYFKLDKNFLHYYLHKSDVIPRKTLQITKDVKIILDPVSRVVNGTAYYPFIISSPQSATVYRLSSYHQEEANEWVRLLKGVANAESIRDSFSGPTTSDLVKEALPPSPEKEEVEAFPVTDTDEDDKYFHKSAVLSNLNPSMIEKINRSVDTILDLAFGSPDEWSLLFEKKGVVATRKIGSGIICVRGETILPYTIPEIYGIVSRPERRKQLDSMLEVYSRIKWFSHHTGVEYLQSKGVWPTAPRDFSNISHWRLLKDGTFITLGYGDQIDECPEKDGIVRGSLLIGGYVMQHLPGGTRIFIVVQCDLGGTLPTAVTNLAAQSQPMVLVTLRSILDKEYADKVRPDMSSSQPPRYEELFQIAKENVGNSLQKKTNEKKMTSSRAQITLPKENKMEQPSKLPTIERNEAPPNYFFMFKITIICTTFLLSFMKFGGLSTTLIITCFYLFLCLDSWQKSIPSGKQVHHLQLSVKGLLQSCDENLVNSNFEFNAYHVVLMKLSKILSSHASFAGILVNGHFYPSPQSKNVGVSLLSPSNHLLKLDNVANKSITQLASDIVQSDRKPNKPMTLSLLQLMKISFHRFITLLLPELFTHSPISHSTSPYGAALIIPFGEEVTETSLYLVDTPTASIQPPMTIFVPKMALHQRNFNNILPVTVVIEKSVMSLHQGSLFLQELRRALDTPPSSLTR